MTDKKWMMELAQAMDEAQRIERNQNSVEHIEGDTYIELSDELAKEISSRIRKISDSMVNLKDNPEAFK